MRVGSNDTVDFNLSTRRNPRHGAECARNTIFDTLHPIILLAYYSDPRSLVWFIAQRYSAKCSDHFSTQSAWYHWYEQANLSSTLWLDLACVDAREEPNLTYVMCVLDIMEKSVRGGYGPSRQVDFITFAGYESWHDCGSNPAIWSLVGSVQLNIWPLCNPWRSPPCSVVCQPKH